MNRTPPSRPIIRTQADLLRLWTFVLAPEPQALNSIWAIHLDADRRPTSPVVQVEEGAAEPSTRQALDLVAVLALTEADRGDGGSWAFLRSRRGSSGVGDDDRVWARRLIAACAEVGIACEQFHVAEGGAVIPLAGDDLLVA